MEEAETNLVYVFLLSLPPLKQIFKMGLQQQAQ